VKLDKVRETKKFMDKAIKNCLPNREPSLYFFRGLLNYHCHNFYESLKDFNEAINLEQESTAIFYLARGRAFACMAILTEAMKDISIALNLDESLLEAYYFRGCCAYLLGDSNLAFLDFQRMINSEAKSAPVHVHAGKLLMTTGAYEDAIKAFMNADAIEVTQESLYQ
jgi:tetratricopeptide (TPR) repeat protein